MIVTVPVADTPVQPADPATGQLRQARRGTVTEAVPDREPLRHGHAMSRVVVVDDDRPLARALAINLRAHGYQVTLAHDGRTALTEVARTQPAVVVLDLGLPGPGRHRGAHRDPLLVRGARHRAVRQIDLRREGRGAGRRRRRLRHQTLRHGRTPRPHPRVGPPRHPAVTAAADHAVTTPDFTIDLGAHRVHRNGDTVRLTPTEWSLLEMLVRHSGKLVTQKQILTDIWGPASEEQTHYLRVYLAQLRRKLEPDPAHPRYLITEPGLGYRFLP